MRENWKRYRENSSVLSVFVFKDLRRVVYFQSVQFFTCCEDGSDNLQTLYTSERNWNFQRTFEKVYQELALCIMCLPRRDLER